MEPPRYKKSMINDQVSPIRILIVDDHAILRFGLRAIVERHAHMVVVGEAADCTSAVALATAEQPDIILLDLVLGQECGSDVLPKIFAVAPYARVIVVTGVQEADIYEQAILRGAVGLVMKKNAMEQIIKAIEKVQAGEVWLDRSMIATVLNHAQSNSQVTDAQSLAIASLTNREREVIQLVGKGMQNKAIAACLTVSEATVRNHMTHILAKLGLVDRFELAIYAYTHGLASPPSKE
jgi:DNA-binding NarL/FixJ family response regulator